MVKREGFVWMVMYGEGRMVCVGGQIWCYLMLAIIIFGVGVSIIMISIYIYKT